MAGLAWFRDMLPGMLMVVGSLLPLSGATDGHLHKEEPSPYMDHGMIMYFHAGAHSQILFKGWMTHNWQQMLGSCIGIFLIAALYEGLKVGRELLQQKMTASGPTSEVYPISDNVTSDSPPNTLTSSKALFSNTGSTARTSLLSSNHLVQTLLHIVQVWFSFCLMLVFMTFNVWLCLSVTFGAGAGYFVFAWLRPTGPDTNEHCN